MSIHLISRQRLRLDNDGLPSFIFGEYAASIGFVVYFHLHASLVIGGCDIEIVLTGNLVKLVLQSMDVNLQGWYTEQSPMWPGQAFSLKVKEKLFHMKSNFQEIEIFESTNHGRVLVLDKAIQCTESDESSYQEMITFLPVNSHPCPKKVLVIGGGDGGVLRELAKHPKVEEIYHCEIDEEVIKACKTYLPSMGCGFNSTKLKSFTGDGAQFLSSTEETFDIIITDASDPVVGSEDESQIKNGPAESLFNDDYYKNMKAKLNEGGILCCQGENMWLHATLIARILKICREAYPVVEYAYTCTPSYPSGQIGFILCSRNPSTNFREPLLKWSDEDIEKYSLKYYNEDIHRASFILPSFMKKILK